MATEPTGGAGAVSAADIAAKADQVAAEGRIITAKVLDASMDNNKNNGLIKISNGPQSNIQNIQSG